MNKLELQKVEIQAGFSFEDQETGISINGSCSLDNQTRKVKELQGTAYEGNTLIGTVAAHTAQDGRTFNTVAPYDMADSVPLSVAARDLYLALEQYDYTPGAAEPEAEAAGEPEPGQEPEEGGES